jgi:ribonuclease P protein component
VNTKDGPATTAALKRLLHAELSRLLASQRPRRQTAVPPTP